MKFLGIDGGGTSTEFIIVDNLGNILGYTIKSTLHHKQSSFIEFENILIDGITELIDSLNISIDDIDYTVLGIPGYGEYVSEIPKINKIINRIIKNNYKIVNDSEIAWAGSLLCEPGINIVSGTGSIGYGVDKNDKNSRSGGWGPYIGDEGSAYWLGKKIIENFTRVSDGRIEKNQLYYDTKEYLKIEEDMEILSIIVEEYNMDRIKIANLSKIINISLDKNDIRAIEIVKEAAYELSLLVKSIYNELDYAKNDIINISYSGGIFNIGEDILNPFEKYILEIDSRMKLVKPKLSPVLGSVFYAYKQLEFNIDESIINNFIKSNEKLKENSDEYNIK